MIRLIQTLSLAGVLVAALSCSRSSPRVGSGGGGMGSAGTNGDLGTALDGLSNPNLRDVCAQDGTIAGVIDRRCPSHQDGWSWAGESVIYDVMPVHSSRPSCPLDEEEHLKGLDRPGWLLRIDSVLGPFPVSPTSDHYHTVVVGTRMDVSEPCAIRVVWKIKQHSVNLRAGMTVRYARRFTIRSVEDDVTVTSVLRDEQGGFLLGLMSGGRPTAWDRDIWPELTLGVEAQPVCSDARFPTLKRLRVTLSSGADQCVLEAQTARCCTFASEIHTVMAIDAFRDTAPQGAVGGEGTVLDHVTILVAKKGVLTPL